MTASPGRAVWASGDCAMWASALAAYPTAVARRGADRLPELDAWYRDELPRAIVSRREPHVTRGELSRVTEWKMKRGAWRARNLALVRQNGEDEVIRASAAAFALLPDARRPLAALAALRGVGPATASAVLAAARPDVFPFLDEEVAACVPELPAPAFTAAYYARYAAALRARAEVLDEACPGAGWDAQRVGLALWAAARAGAPAARER